jgi:hypothetical protein
MADGDRTIGGPVFPAEVVEAARTDLPDGVDAVLCDKRTRLRVEAAAYLTALGLKITISEARRMAWRSAISRGDATAVTGLANGEGDG